jgi:hypothetical protein
VVSSFKEESSFQTAQTPHPKYRELQHLKRGIIPAPVMSRTAPGADVSERLVIARLRSKAFNRLFVANVLPFAYLDQAMTAAFPQIGKSDGIDVIEIDEAIRATVHHCKRDWTAFHDQTLIHACSGTRGLGESLAKTAVCARDGMPKECLGRRIVRREAEVLPVPV